jgi:septal ring factor EnvC (AmiA/AmiB activator)
MIHRMSRKHLLAGLAAAGVLGVGIAAPTVALADDKSPSARTSTDQDTGRQQQRADRQAEFAEALAKELGVSTDKVTAALEKLREQHQADRPDRPERPSTADRQAALKERLDQAVKDGKLTQEQADAVLKAAEAGVFPGPGGGHGHRGGTGQTDR